jgi:hypothetical protein
MWNFIKGVNPPIKKRKTEDKTHDLKSNPFDKV